MAKAMTKQEKLDKIGNLLCDSTIGKLTKDKRLQGDDEEFGGLVTIGYLFRKIYPILKELKEEI